MKWVPKHCFVLLFSILTTALYAQADSTGMQPEEETNVFLLTVATIFIGALLGAAIIGAFFATLFLLLFSALIAFGLLSTAALIGLYKRSLAAGFKSFLVLLFGTVCSVFGLIGILLFNHFFPLHLSNLSLSLLGFIAGLLGGMLLGTMSFAVLKTALSRLAKKVRPA